MVPLCGAEAEMVALASVGVITNLDQLALEAWLNSDALHRSRDRRVRLRIVPFQL